MKKVSKILTMLLIVFLIVTTMVPVFAKDQADAYDPVGYDGKSSNASVGKINTLGQDIVKVITTIGSIVSVIVLVVLGIKYMMGSAEEKAEYKKTLLPYIIGAAFVFAASTIASIIFNFASSF
ncbi:MAG: hypothetical protein HFJ40_08555 [Clostridia bacterium]|nr:hypothetical protein [Clostridia bacterium]